MFVVCVFEQLCLLLLIIQDLHCVLTRQPTGLGTGQTRCSCHTLQEWGVGGGYKEATQPDLSALLMTTVSL